MMTRTKYAVTFTNVRGEQREVVVVLTEEELGDCARQATSHGCPGEGWPPLENRYAATRAAEGMPPEFVETFPEIHRVIVH
jgi:hypothetical protein